MPFVPKPPYEAPPILESAFYVSRALVAKDEVPGIVAHSRSANARKGLTGGLLFTGNFFAQCIEGPPAVLQDTMALINADPRHGDILHIAGGPVRKRSYEKWTMGFIDAPLGEELITAMLNGSVDRRREAQVQLLLLEWISGGL